MGFFKKLPHMATPAELQEIRAGLDADMEGLTQKWALESLGVEKLLPLINIVDNEKSGKTKAILYAYRYGYLAKSGKGIRKVASMKRAEGYRQRIIEIINKIDDPDILMEIYTVAKTHLEILEEEGSKHEQSQQGGTSGYTD